MTDQILSIQINTKDIEVARIEGGKFLINKNAENGLLKLLELQEQVADTIEAVKILLAGEMEKNNTVKIEGEQITVGKQFFGERYELYDKDIALENEMAKQVTSTKVDITAVDDYLKTNNAMPEGVKLRDRTASVTIRQKKKNVK
jgi:hypothetical protein